MEGLIQPSPFPDEFRVLLNQAVVPCLEIAVPLLEGHYLPSGLLRDAAEALPFLLAVGVGAQSSGQRVRRRRTIGFAD